jgi:hypothetical protein
MCISVLMPMAACCFVGLLRHEHRPRRVGEQTPSFEVTIRDERVGEHAVGDLSAAIFGAAYLWTVLADGYDPDRELEDVRERFIRDCGFQPAR